MDPENTHEEFQILDPRNTHEKILNPQNTQYKKFWTYKIPTKYLE